jgi:hypothetical protein
MDGVTTTQAIAGSTDEAMFERLATAVLRAAEPVYRNLLHPGVNADGKTVMSPLDGIHFVPGAHPAHSVHHTITGIDGLEGKWLHDPKAGVQSNRRHGVRRRCIAAARTH